MKKWLRVKYPKFLLLILTIVAAYFLFAERGYIHLDEILLPLGYFGTFISGALFAYGFTAAPATAMLLVLAKGQNIFLAAIAGGLGALVGDMIIFSLIRHSFNDEIEKLSKEKFMLFLKRKSGSRFRKYVAPAIAGLVIASPLPDEIGVSMVAALKSFSRARFMVISFVLNTTGIFVVLLAGSLI